MQKQSARRMFLIKVPVRIEVRYLKDGTEFSCNETTIEDVIYSDFLSELEQEIQTNNHSSHQEEKNRLNAYVRRELLSKEAPDSPIYEPNTWVDVIIEGDISTWEKEPYREKSATRN